MSKQPHIMKKSLGALLVFGVIFLGAIHTASAFTVADLLQKVQALKSEVQTLGSSLSAAAIKSTSTETTRTSSAQSVEKLTTQIDAIETTIKTAPASEIASVVVSPVTTDTIIFSQDLKSGIKNDDVVKLQDFLKAQGYFQGTSTGLFGPKTIESLKLWQNLNGLNPTGVFDAKTRAVINSLRIKAPVTTTTADKPTPGTGTGTCVVDAFTAIPNPVTVGASVTIAWFTTNCTGAVITNVATNYTYTVPAGSVASGTVTRTFTTPGIYAFGIRASGAGTLAGKSVNIVVNPADPWTTMCADGQPHIQVLSPNGGETYTAGQQVTVKWRSCNFGTSNVYVQIIGWNPDWFSAEGYPNRANTGSAVITIPNSVVVNGQSQIPLGGYNVPEGKKFSVEVGKQYAVSGPSIMDRSDSLFTINAVPVTNVCPPGTTPSITILSPNGGEVFTAGQQVTVKWKSCNVPTTAQVGVSLSYSGPWTVGYGVAGLGTTNTGSVIYTLPGSSAFVPGAYQYGTLYKFQVKFNDTIDSSDSLFTINNSTTTVYACNDGIDNDGDGKVDLNDPGCASSTDNDEYNTPAQNPLTVISSYSGVGYGSSRQGIFSVSMKIKNNGTTAVYIPTEGLSGIPNTNTFDSVQGNIGGSSGSAFISSEAVLMPAGYDFKLNPGEEKYFTLIRNLSFAVGVPQAPQNTVRMKVQGIPYFSASRNDNIGTPMIAPITPIHTPYITL